MRTILKSTSAISLVLLAACAVQTSDDGAQSSESDLAIIGAPISKVDAGGVSVSTLFDRAFYFQGLGSRCFDFGGQAWWAPGAPVILYGCNGTVAQQVRVKEIDFATHDVELRVQSLYCIGVRGGSVVVGAPLELQTCNGQPSQRFALDGDSVIMGYQTSGKVTREVVIEPALDASPNRTPLVVGTRDTSDAEYIRLQSVDGSSIPPTHGYVKVSTEEALHQAFALGWGAVIEVDDAKPLTLTIGTAIPEGVTLRGYRKHRNPGAVITYIGTADSAINVHADDVRITGLRFLANPNNGGGAISITTDQHQRVLVDHNEITGGWKGPAVTIGGGDAPCDPTVCSTPPQGACFPPSAYVGALAFPRPTDVRVLRNFVHENSSYGIVTGDGAMILAQGNVEFDNQHQLASDPWRLSGYVAYDNFLLGPAVDSDHSSNQDFDAHGSLNPGHWYDGIAGDYFDIGWNTFLQTSHYDFNLRGTPCRSVSFHDNVSTESQGDALTSLSTKSMTTYGDVYGATGAAHPTADLGVGDFDGDHVDDVFVGTGVTWWFSSGGVSEWRLLNRMPEHASQVRFGDFDGDGRTDVLTVHNGSIDVSWSGNSPWQTINNVGWALSDLAVGDFDGDHVSDLFLATGSEFFYAPGATSWKVFSTAAAGRTPDLRFGDFTGDGKTDVFAVNGNQWQILPGGGTSFQVLRSALTTSTAGLVVADFDGDGVADVARTLPGSLFTSPEWQYAARGWGGFVNLRSDSQNVASLPMGHFDLDGKADFLEWTGNRFGISSAATGAITTVSTQAMR